LDGPSIAVIPREFSFTGISILSGYEDSIAGQARGRKKGEICVSRTAIYAMALTGFSSLLLLLWVVEEHIIPCMRHTWALIGLLAGLCLIGVNTIRLMPATETGHIGWMLYLLACPIVLAGLVRTGWQWTSMACVIYGTVGLALDLSTVTSILRGEGETGTLFLLSAMSGIVNFLLVLLGGRAFVHSFQESSLPGSHPPSPPSPSSSAKP